jgi:hypothetical protein
MRAHAERQRVKPLVLMESDMATQPAEQDGEYPEGEAAGNQIPFSGYVERGEHEEDKGKNEQDN